MRRSTRKTTRGGERLLSPDPSTATPEQRALMFDTMVRALMR